MTKILFITWDGPQTTYMESLFMPIFKEIKKYRKIDFHIIQFTWADTKKKTAIKAIADTLGLIYTSVPILRKPHPALGSFVTLYKGAKFIKSYIKKHKVDIVMPRSTMPAVMLNRINTKIKTFKLIFDADGLPLEERLDFAGLSPLSIQYKFLKKQEKDIIQFADAVLTRSEKASLHHIANNPTLNANKFFVVYNGRDADFFRPNKEEKIICRNELGIQQNEMLFVYCGSLGPQYGWEQMLDIFRQSKAIRPARFLVLTGNTDFAVSNLPKDLTHDLIIKSVSGNQVPKYLNAADIAFAIRQPSVSMTAVAPIKMGEYLLMGLPTIASLGIGDTEKIIETTPNCIIFNHQQPNMITSIVNELMTMTVVNSHDIRNTGLKYFSLERSAESYICAIDYVINN